MLHHQSMQHDIVTLTNYFHVGDINNNVDYTVLSHMQLVCVVTGDIGECDNRLLYNCLMSTSSTIVTDSASPHIRDISSCQLSYAWLDSNQICCVIIE